MRYNSWKLVIVLLLSGMHSSILESSWEGGPLWYFSVSKNLNYSGNSIDNSSLWMTVTLVTGTYGQTLEGPTAILAVQTAWPNPIDLSVINGFLSGMHYVKPSRDPQNPLVSNWQDGIIVSLSHESITNFIWVYVYDHNNNLLVFDKFPNSVLWGPQMQGVAWGGSGVKYMQAFKDEEFGRYPQMGVNNFYTVRYKDQHHITNTSLPANLPTPTHRISPVTATTFSTYPQTPTGKAKNQLDELWLTMKVNGTEYVVVSEPATHSPNYLDSSLNTALQKLSPADWDGGVYFSFIIGKNSQGQDAVSLYVQKVNGQKIGEIVIPGVTTLTTLQNITFQGSFGVNVSLSNQMDTPNDFFSTYSFQTGNRPANAFVKVPYQVQDTTFVPTAMSTIPFVTPINTVQPNEFWLNMVINGKNYTVANGMNSHCPAAACPPGSATLQPYGKPSATSPNSVKFFRSLTLTDFQQGVFFNFLRLPDPKIKNQTHVVLNVQVGDGKGNIFNGKYTKSQEYSLPGVTNINGTNINGNILIGGSYIQNAVSLSPYQTFAVIMPCGTDMYSHLGGWYDFSFYGYKGITPSYYQV